MTKVRDIFRKKTRFFRSNIFENFHWNLYENEKFWDRKFSKFLISKIFIGNWMKIFEIENFRFFDLKNFQHFRKVSLTFVIFKKLQRFFYRSRLNFDAHPFPLELRSSELVFFTVLAALIKVTVFFSPCPQGSRAVASLEMWLTCKTLLKNTVCTQDSRVWYRANN